MNVIKRNGTEVKFESSKIVKAISNANKEVADREKMDSKLIEYIASYIEELVNKASTTYGIEDIQNAVEERLVKLGYYNLAKRYIIYRYEHEILRKKNTTDATIFSLVDNKNELLKQENSNKNSVIAPTQRDYIAGEVSKDLTKRYLLPKDIVDANEEGIIHFHDADYFVQHIYNCCLVNLKDMLDNGTVVSGTKIGEIHKFSTCCTIATQIIAQVASNQYGGQTISLAHLAKYIGITRKRFYKKFIKYKDIMPNEETYVNFIEDMVRDDIKDGIQTIQYQVNTLMTTNGQAPFISVCLYLEEAETEEDKKDLAIAIEEMFNQRIQGIQNESGAWITPAFPKLLYVLDTCNAKPGSEYYWLTKLAAKCTAKRMVPDFISAKKMKEYKKVNPDDTEGDVYPCMGCRSFLTPYVDENGNHKYYGRFNQGVVTINLVDVALSSYKDFDKFWNIFEDRLELCYRALMKRHERLEGTPSDIAPILFQYGAIARLKKGETIDKLLHGGYSTISLGYAGLYECVKYMTGYSHTDPKAKGFALDVMQKMNDKCAEWKAKEDIDFSIYGTPLESTTYEFAKKLQKRFGKIEGITDKNYITNSYHINVREKINAFDKLSFEAEFQRLSPGGAISYVEVPNLQNNLEAIEALIDHTYENIMYAEYNTKSDYCQVCGFDGEIQIIEDENKKLVWECPNCGNRDEDKMNIARRTCGYIGVHYWNQGRTQEIKDRQLHL